MTTSQKQWQASLFNPEQLPDGLCTHNASSVSQRFDVYRNNVTTSLIRAIEDSFPVIAQLVGEDFFMAMAHEYIRQQQPKSPQLTFYGNDFPAFIATFPPAASLPFLFDVARLEMAYLHSYHASDAKPIELSQLQCWLNQPEQLAASIWQLAPSVSYLQFTYAAVDIWQAHQQETPDLSALDWQQPQQTLIVRPSWQPMLVTIDAADYAFIAALGEANSFSTASAIASNCDSAWELTRFLTILLQYQTITNIQETH